MTGSEHNDRRGADVVIAPLVRSFLEHARVARLGTADAEGRPQVVPVCFAVTGTEVCIAIDAKPKRASPRALKRLRNIAANPAVCLTVDRYDDDWSQLGWVMLHGTARVSDEPLPCAAAHQRLRHRYPQYRKMALTGLPVIFIAVERVVSWGNLVVAD